MVVAAVEEAEGRMLVFKAAWYLDGPGEGENGCFVFPKSNCSAGSFVGGV